MRCPDVSMASFPVRIARHTLLAAGLALMGAAAPPLHAADAFTVTSTDLQDGGKVSNQQVYDQDDCKGANRSPQLSWRNVPPGTRSFAITMFDPDAPGRGWWHWAVAGVPADIDHLPANASASGYLRKLGAVEARNDYDTDGYGGPCPPPGKPHHYVVSVYALDTTNLRLATGRPAIMFDHEIGTATLGVAKMTVTYGR